MFRIRLSIGILLLGIFFSCEKKSDQVYNPEISTVADLEFEYQRLKVGIANKLSVLDTVHSEFVASQYLETYQRLWPNVDVLSAKAQSLATTELSAQERTTLQTIIDLLQSKREIWLKLDSDFSIIQEGKEGVLIAFNVLKDFVADPNFTEPVILDKVNNAAHVFSNEPSTQDIAYFSERGDYELFKLLSENFKYFEEKLYPFADLAYETYVIRHYPENLKNSKKLKDLYSALELTETIRNQNKLLYNFILRKMLILVEGNKPAEYDDLMVLGEHVDDLYVLRNAFVYWKQAADLLMTMPNKVKMRADTLLQSVQKVEQIALGDSLFKQFYIADWEPYLSYKNLAGHSVLVSDWQMDYLDLKSKLQLLYDANVEVPVLSDSDQLELETLGAIKEDLIGRYERNFDVFRYVLSGQYNSLTIDIVGTIEWNYIHLLGKIE